MKWRLKEQYRIGRPQKRKFGIADKNGAPQEEIEVEVDKDGYFTVDHAPSGIPIGIFAQRVIES
jgi:hypothetical protein